MKWFTADYHLSHSNIIRYVNRPFNDVDMMNKVILDNLEQRLQKTDVLYYLGDLTFKKKVAKAFFERFNKVEIHYVIGNHDKHEILKVAKKYCKSVSHLKDIQVKNHNITLCHYAMRVWNKSHLNSWQLYGHSHGNLNPIGKQYDVGIDNNDFKPVSLDKIEEIMERSPNNFNYIAPKNRQSKR